MLYFTRWKAAAILLPAFVVCLFAVPNFLPEKMVQSWPKWAQRHVVLGLDLQGGSHILLEVDTNAVRKEKLESLRDDVAACCAMRVSGIPVSWCVETASKCASARAAISIRRSTNCANSRSLSAAFLAAAPASALSM
jgi:preprotein translocase subunit SecD